VHLRAGSLGEGLPARDRYIAPGHSMLVDGTLGLAKLLVNGLTITQNENPDKSITFRSNWTNTTALLLRGRGPRPMQTGRRGAATLTMQRSSMRCTRITVHRRPRVCAPRPERGAALESALRPVIERAAQGFAPGPMRGHLDQVQGELELHGWAHDPTIRNCRCCSRF